MHRLFRFSTRALLIVTALVALSLYAYGQWYQYYQSHVYVSVARFSTGEKVTEYRYRTRLLYPGIIPSYDDRFAYEGEWQVHRGPDDLCLYAPPEAKLQVQIDSSGMRTIPFESYISDSKSIVRHLQIITEPTQTISGRVVDQSTDLPVANARVGQEVNDRIAWPSDNNSSDFNFRRLDPNSRIMTDEHGYFELPWADMSQPVMIEHPDFVLASEHMASSMDNVIQLKHGLAIHGKVVDESNGQPVSDAYVFAAGPHSYETPERKYALMAKTNEYGEYTGVIDKSQIGRLARIVSPNFGLTDLSWQPNEQEVVSMFRRTRIDEPTLPTKSNDRATISGWLAIPKEECGEYRVKVSIEALSDRNRSEKSTEVRFVDNAGRFELNEIPFGQSTIVLKRNGVALVSQELEVNQRSMDLGCIDLPITGGIKGVVQAEDGKPSSFREIFLYGGPQHQRIEVRCDRKGAFELKHVLPGDYEMSLESVDWSCFGIQSDLTVTIMPNETITLDTTPRSLIQFEGLKERVDTTRGSIKKASATTSASVISEHTSVDHSDGNKALLLQGRNITSGDYSCELTIYGDHVSQRIDEPFVVTRNQSQPKIVQLELKTLRLILPPGMHEHVDQKNPSAASTDDRLPPRIASKQTMLPKYRLSLLQEQRVVSELECDGLENIFSCYTKPDSMPDAIQIEFPDGQIASGAIEFVNGDWVTHITEVSSS